MMCQRAIRAVRAVLEEEAYAGRIEFEVLHFESEKGRRAQKDSCFGADRHGFLVFRADGTQAHCRAGHAFAEPEVRADLDRALDR
jgi:hypothetical protein